MLTLALSPSQVRREYSVHSQTGYNILSKEPLNTVEIKAALVAFRALELAKQQPESVSQIDIDENSWRVVKERYGILDIRPLIMNGFSEFATGPSD